MLEKMVQLLKSSCSCVLATCSNNRPHCSLMAYVTDDAGRTVYMITRKKSRKYGNMQENPLVSFLVDTRGAGDSQDMSQVSALTVHGRFHPLANPAEKQAVLNRLLERQPHLKELPDHPDIEVSSIAVESFLLLDGVVNAYFEILQ